MKRKVIGKLDRGVVVLETVGVAVVGAVAVTISDRGMTAEKIFSLKDRGRGTTIVVAMMVV